MDRIWNQVWLWVVCALVAGCASSGPVESPVVRALSWFSYVGGDDLRAACKAGSLDRYRLVYNGNYLEQRRTYDILAVTGGGATVSGRVIGEANLASGIPFLDPLAPWRGKSFETRLDLGQLRALRVALDASGVGGLAPRGLELPSDSFFWAAAACQGGAFHFNAWAYPSPAFDALTFVDVLMASDASGVPLNKARPIAYFSLRDQEEAQRFVLKVGENGLDPF